ncbi:MAG: hypothetical protein WBW74_26450 [Xanthobacteraceae bacterium]
MFKLRHRHRCDARSVQGYRCVLYRHDERQGADGVLEHRRRAEGAVFLRAEFEKWKQVIADGKIKDN